MIYYEVHENGAVLKAFRKALKNDPNVSDNVPHSVQMYQLGKSNNMQIIGKFDGRYWETTGFEFPNEQSLAMFLLRWAG